MGWLRIVGSLKNGPTEKLEKRRISSKSVQRDKVDEQTDRGAAWSGGGDGAQGRHTGKCQTRQTPPPILTQISSRGGGVANFGPS